MRQDAWRRTSGVHRLRGRRSLAAAKALWEARDEIAARRDVTPGQGHPRRRHRRRGHRPAGRPGRADGTPGFHGRGADRYARTWVTTLATVLELPEDELPIPRPASGRPAAPARCGPSATSWPTGASRPLAHRCSRLAEDHHLPGREPPDPRLRAARDVVAARATREPADLADALRNQLAGYGARPWQVELVTGALTGAVLAGDVEPDAREPADTPDDPGELQRLGLSSPSPTRSVTPRATR